MEKIKSNNKSIYVLIILVPFLMGLGVDLYVPSLLQISSFFKSSSNLVELTVSLYLLGYGLGQIVLGILSDSLGRKKILVISTILFILMSLGCIISFNLILLNLFRFFQGIFVAGLAVVARAALVDLFAGTELSKFTNYFTISWSLGPIIAPFIGSFLANSFGWKSNFYLFTVYGIVIFVYSIFIFKETNIDKSKIDIKTYKLNIIKICTSPMFILITVVSALGYGAIVLFNTVGPYLIEKTLRYSITDYGYIAMFLGFAYFLGAIINRILIKKVKSDALLSFGIMGAIICGIIMWILSYIQTNKLVAIIIPIFCMFFLVGFIVPNALYKTMELFKDIAGTASAIFGTLTGIVVFIITLLGENLTISSQLPLTLGYLIIFILAIILIIISKRLMIKIKI